MDKKKAMRRTTVQQRIEVSPNVIIPTCDSYGMATTLMIVDAEAWTEEVVIVRSSGPGWAVVDRDIFDEGR